MHIYVFESDALKAYIMGFMEFMGFIQLNPCAYATLMFCFPKLPH